MLVIPQAVMDEILDHKIKRRTITLPMRRETIRRTAVHPRLKRTLSSPTSGSERGSALRRCPLREGGNYEIRGDGIDRVYARLRSEAEAQPDRARAVTWLLLRAEDETRELRITVREVKQRDDEWIVTFYLDSRGEIRDKLDDEPFFLARTSGYVTGRDELDAGAVLMPLAKDLEEARKKAREGRLAPERAAIKEAVREIDTCRRAMSNMKAQTRLRRAMKEVRAAEAELAAEAADTVPVSECAARRSSPVEDDQPCGTKSDVSLRSERSVCSS